MIVTIDPFYDESETILLRMIEGKND